MATRLAFKQRVILPEWDGEPDLPRARHAAQPTLVLGGLIWLMTLGLGAVVQWHRPDVAQGVSAALTWARNSFLGPAESGTRTGWAPPGFSGTPGPRMAPTGMSPGPPPAAPRPALSASGSMPPVFDVPPNEPQAPEEEPSSPLPLSKQERRVAAGHFGRVDVVSWSHTRRLAEAVGSGAFSDLESASSGGDADDFNDREFLEDLKSSVRTGVVDKEPEVHADRVHADRVHADRVHADRRERSGLQVAPPRQAASSLPARPRPRKAAKSVTSSSGTSCEAARARYSEKVEIGKRSTARDTPRSTYQSILNRGEYFSGCGVPAEVRVTICAAIHHGRAVGVTVSTQPAATATHACIANGVRRLRFPDNERLDVVTTRFEPAR